MMLIVIDTRTGHRRTIVVPVKAPRQSFEPGEVIRFPRLATRG
jgi:hypothetical protein